ncbi:MAG TPA: hypothetical protein VKK81_20550, partial [Candidatus Binatia bacterium]|nr:hypothetical protein [Candidatus Binatia bacterium]
SLFGPQLRGPRASSDLAGVGQFRDLARALGHELRRVTKRFSQGWLTFIFSAPPCQPLCYLIVFHNTTGHRILEPGCHGFQYLGIAEWVS